ncbi:hypothetical protein KY327_00360 [Candidatus Woesearchaeota archaeon]|nr:hypothetical protein [Candidatus Woesearchaeota archaeon]
MLQNEAAVILAIIIGTLAAIVYSLRVLILLERRIARIDMHIELMAKSILKDEEEIEGMLQHRRSSAKKTSAKKRGRPKKKK